MYFILLGYCFHENTCWNNLNNNKYILTPASFLLCLLFFLVIFVEIIRTCKKKTKAEINKKYVNIIILLFILINTIINIRKCKRRLQKFPN